MQNFVRFRVIESEVELLQEIWENGITANPTELYIPKLHYFFLLMYSLYKIFRANSSTRNRDQRIPKIPEKE